MKRQTKDPEIRPVFRSVLICLWLVLLFACRPQQRIDGYLHQRLAHDPSTLDPAHIVDVTGGMIAAKLFNGLVQLNEKLEIVPDIAERWTVSRDGKEYTFYLGRNIRFHNKRHVSAEDFRYSFERLLSPDTGSPNRWVLERISGAAEYIKGKTVHVSGIRVLDDHALQISLKEPFAPFLHLLTMPPAYVIPREDAERWGRDFAYHPSGTGPFKLSGWRHNVSVMLDRNSDYFGGEPAISGIMYRIIPEDITASAEFELGNLDILSVSASEYRRYRESDRWKGLISSLEGINSYYLGLNCSKPPLSDPLARKAVSMAIDREKILHTYYEGRGRLAHGPVPDILRNWNMPDMQSYDPEKAAMLAIKSGLKGRVLKFFVSADPENIDIAEIVQSYLKKAGIEVEIRPLEWSAYKSAVNNGEPDMFWLSWWADYPDPENFLFPLFHSSNHGAGGNRTRYTNLAVDALIDRARRSMSASDKSAAFAMAEITIAGDAPWVFFWHKNEYIVRQPGLKKFRIYPIYSIDKGMEISF